VKRTPEDIEFSAEFGRQLQARYQAATDRARAGSEALTDDEFAATLDVSRPALKKYLAGRAMPALRTIILAYRRHGIAIPYLGTELFSAKRRRGGTIREATQLVLPFSVRGLGISGVESKISATGENRYELRVNVKVAL
jgi:hypothetical protein